MRFLLFLWVFSGGSVVKNPPANAGDMSSVPGLGRSPGGRHGHPLQYSCWRIPWTEEAGRVHSTGSHRVGHNQATNTFPQVSPCLEALRLMVPQMWAVPSWHASFSSGCSFVFFLTVKVSFLQSQSYMKSGYVKVTTVFMAINVTIQ